MVAHPNIAKTYGLLMLRNQTIQKQIACKNCEQEFEKGFEFCPYCGQKAKDDLTIGVLFYNTISNYFSFDARFLRSFIPLMFRIKTCNTE